MIGLLRVKNEGRWIAQVLRSIEHVCSDVIVLDDHSTDDTAEIARAYGVSVHRSPFEGLDEARDKDYLLELAWRCASPGDWALMIDGDEALAPGDDILVRDVAAHCPADMAFSLQVLYLWGSPTVIRVDGVYGRFSRPSLFRMTGRDLSFRRTGNGGNFHCGNVPWQLARQARPCGARLLHYGYMDRADRLRKYEWYNQRDPRNAAEDCYRHMVQGDLPEVPPSAHLLHAGPLALETI